MGLIHLAIVKHIRDANADQPELGVTALDDEQIVHQMFFNYRGGKGLRLTEFGIQVMRTYFQSYAIRVPEGEQVRPLNLIFLDHHAKMPYFCGEKEIVVFDHELGMMLKLVNGRLSLVTGIN